MRSGPLASQLVSLFGLPACVSMCCTAFGGVVDQYACRCQGCCIGIFVVMNINPGGALRVAMVHGFFFCLENFWEGKEKLPRRFMNFTNDVDLRLLE
jgi:hypothetical protein